MGVQIDLPFVVNAIAIAIMIVGLFMVFGLRRRVRSGAVASAWKILSFLVVVFTLAYLGTPFFGLLPPDSVRMVFATVFLLGAVYVVMTIRLVQRVLDDVA